jgi:hypothetical protein
MFQMRGPKVSLGSPDLAGRSAQFLRGYDFISEELI